MQAATRLQLITFLGILIGFQLSYGLQVIVPTNINWLLSVYHDWGQHYLGFAYFRDTPWHFPLGKIDTINYPTGTNIGFMDAIPLFGLIFKVLSPVLPEEFQYLGLYLFFGYCMLGYFTLKLFKLFNASDTLAFLATIFVVFNPLLFYRAIHFSSTAHWLIVASIYTYLKPVTRENYNRIQLQQIGLLLFAALVNPYMFLFIVGFHFILPIKHIYFDKVISLKNGLIYFGSGIATALFAWYCVGMIGIDNETSLEVGNSYGLYSANLNTFFNSSGYSSIIPELPRYSELQYEGFAYLGLGGILLVIIAALTFTYSYYKHALQFSNRYYLLPLYILVLLVTLFAITNKISYGNQLLFTIPLPNLLLKIGNIFRASGRYIWLLYYFIFIGSLYAIITLKIKPIYKYILFVLLFSVQFYDIKIFFRDRGYQFGTYTPKPLKQEAWLQLASNFKIMITYPPFENSLNYTLDYQDLCFLALKAHVPITTGYVARETTQSNAIFLDSLHKQLETGNIDTNALFITTPQHIETFLPLVYTKKLKMGALDGYFYLYSAKNHVTEEPQSSPQVDSLLSTISATSYAFKFPAHAALRDSLARNIEKYAQLDNTIKLVGWAFDAKTSNSIGDSIFFTLENNSTVYAFACQSITRQDVTGYFKAENLDNSGFKTIAFADKLPNGEYKPGIAIKKTDGRILYTYLADKGAIAVSNLGKLQLTSALPASTDDISINIEKIENQDFKISTQGWAFAKNHSAEVNQLSLYFISGAKNYVLQTSTVTRGDVTSYFKNGYNLDNSGFQASFDTSQLPKGDYVVGACITTKDGKQHFILTDKKLSI